MHLERLEINGFKSFSDRSELAFDKGVTAIVGPNGCGKSNIADAITWVMGEQSAKSLRGDTMENVIFGGSDARKPTAAAEVRLRLTGVLKTVSGPAFGDDQGNGNGSGNGHGAGNGNGRVGYESSVVSGVVSGFSRTVAEELIQSVAREVEVTRRLYRSGESEYLIDGRTCRLRDVHDLLMDTGLGAKHYAIIEQGKIGMILSARPTDRRQLIEEAAGITKYKVRRRAAELKLDAARLNLTRVDDIVFEVEKQRGTLKRQAARARRYQKLRDELRRWEKVSFARKYARLGEAIESARGRLIDAREREAVASSRVAHMESDLGRLRIEMAEAETHATGAREAAHARELAINRQQQQIAFAREQVATLDNRSTSIAVEVATLDARREPGRVALAGRREAAVEADAERERTAIRLSAESAAYEAGHREIEGLESDVEAARSEVFSAINSATALRHALEHAGTARERVAETLNKLAVEADDARIESERAAAGRATAADGLGRAQELIEATRVARLARESELASARIEHEWRARSVRAGEQTLAGLEARLTSLAEVEAARASYGDAPRAVLAQANGKVNQQGAIADYLEVEAGYERAVEAYLGDLLQHVVVEQPEHAAAGFDVVREAGAGRCGFLITTNPAEAGSHDGHIETETTETGAGSGFSRIAPDGHLEAQTTETGVGSGFSRIAPDGHLEAQTTETGAGSGFSRIAPDGHLEAQTTETGVGSGFSRIAPDGHLEAQTTETGVGSGFSRIAPDGLVALHSMVHVNGPFAGAITQAIGDAWIADSYDAAQAASRLTGVPVVTVDGAVFRGPQLVSGGSRDDARGILETKREIKELRERIDVERSGLRRLAEETASLEGTIATATHAVAALNAEHHKQEKAVVGFEVQLRHATDETVRLALKGEQLDRERRQAEEERDALDRRRDEARESIVRLQDGQQHADERLTLAQRRLFEAREATEDLSRSAAEARAAHAAMVERASGLALEVQRLEEAAAELDARAAALATELETTRQRLADLRTAIQTGQAQHDADVHALDALRMNVQDADAAVSTLRVRTDDHEASLRIARAALESIRGLVAELDVARATAESDLGHLATSCLDTVQATLDQVRVEVQELERAGNLTPDGRIISASDEPEGEEDDPTAGLKTCATTDAEVLVAQDFSPAVSPAVDSSPALEAAEQRALSAEEAIAQLRARIDRLGPVNMMAIEQFDELEARHTFLTSERKDLVDSIAQTREAIQRIDDTTRQRFGEALAAINRNFQETFGTLFGGGRAGLTLLDENDPLESGIEIIAQPPGKRLQSVQLLSGGEKALTAIALMFGMFKYKPSPFCLLDEIDAPLDDANIGRFVEMLRGMQEHTQFIVITHNRKTMEIADRLYGVTMEEPGVSKLISVQLN